MKNKCPHCHNRGALVITYYNGGRRGVLVECDHCENPPDKEAQEILDKQKLSQTRSR